MVGTLKDRRPSTPSANAPKPEPTDVSSRRKRRKSKSKEAGWQHQEPTYLGSYLLKRLIVLAATVLVLTSSGSSLYKRSPRRFLQAEDDFSTIKIYHQSRDEQQNSDITDAKNTQLMQGEDILRATSGVESLVRPTESILARTTFTARQITTISPAPIQKRADNSGATQVRKGIRGKQRVDQVDRVLKGGGGMSAGGMGGSGGNMSGEGSGGSMSGDGGEADDDGILSDGEIDLEEAVQIAKIVGHVAYDAYKHFVPTYFTPNPTPAPTTSAPTTSLAPSNQPSNSLEPSFSPSLSQVPSEGPTGRPSSSAPPSKIPSQSPSLMPSTLPSAIPSSIPSQSPSLILSAIPSVAPSLTPSSIPSVQPSLQPSSQPSIIPTVVPVDPMVAGEGGEGKNIFNQNENVNFGTGDDKDINQNENADFYDKDIMSQAAEEEEHFEFGSPDESSYAWWNEPDRN